MNLEERLAATYARVVEADDEAVVKGAYIVRDEKRAQEVRESAPDGADPRMVEQLAREQGALIGGPRKRRRDMTEQERQLHDAERRRIRQRQAARRKAIERQNEAVEEAVAPTTGRMTGAWLVVASLQRIIELVAATKRAQMRHAGRADLAEVTADLTDKVVREVARSDRPMAELIGAADWLAGHAGIPTHVDALDPETPRGSKWLMGVVNNRAKDALRDWFRANPQTESLDTLETLLHQLSGEDGLIAGHTADRAPRFLGGSFPQPGRVDRELFSVLVSQAITERGLDEMVDVLLDDDNRNSDGSVRWTKCARALWLAAGLDPAVFRRLGTNERKAEAARALVRNRFASCRCDDPLCAGWLAHGMQVGMRLLGEPVHLGMDIPQTRTVRPYTDPKARAKQVIDNLARMYAEEGV